MTRDFVTFNSNLVRISHQEAGAGFLHKINSCIASMNVHLVGGRRLRIDYKWGIKWGPYKWPKMNGYLGFYNPYKSSYFTLLNNWFLGPTCRVKPWDFCWGWIFVGIHADLLFVGIEPSLLWEPKALTHGTKICSMLLCPLNIRTIPEDDLWIPKPYT